MKGYLPRRTQRGRATTEEKNTVFTTEDTEITEVLKIRFRILRVLRELRGEQNQGKCTRLPTQEPEELEKQLAMENEQLDINVKFMGDLRALLQRRTLTVTLPQGSTVGDLFASLSGDYGEPFASRVFTHSGALQHYILVFLNGQNIKDVGGLAAGLGAGEVEIVMLPMFEGG